MDDAANAVACDRRRCVRAKRKMARPRKTEA